MSRKPSSQTNAQQVQRFTDTAYDIVKEVWENLDVITSVDSDMDVLGLYLGSHESDPTVGWNDEPIVNGNYYFNSITGELRYYSESSDTWIASDASTVLEYALRAEEARDAVLISEQNAKASADAAALSATTAKDAETQSLAHLDSTVEAKDAAEVAQLASELAETNAAASELNASMAASTASSKATEASNSAAAAKVSEGIAQQAATDAGNAIAASEAARDAAQLAQSGAEAAETQAEQHKNDAQTFASNASTSAGLAAGSAGTAGAHASAAEGSEQAAATSESAAATHASNAQDSAIAANNSAGTASTKASEAAASAVTAAGHETGAGDNAALAAGSVTDASNYAALSQRYANEQEDTIVDGADYSAKHWAKKAEKASKSIVRSGGLWTPSAGNEYPTPFDADIDEQWIIQFDDAATRYTFQTGDLAGTSVGNMDILFFDDPSDVFDVVPSPSSNAVIAVNGKTGSSVTVGSDDVPHIDLDSNPTTVGVQTRNHQTMLNQILADMANKANVVHVHSEADITDLDKYSQAEVNAIESSLLTQIGTRAPQVHVHTEAQISDLDKYTKAEVDAIKAELESDLTGKANTVHSHTEAQITNLNKYTREEVDALVAVKADLTDVVEKDSNTGAAEIPTGTTAQAGLPTLGRFRINSETMAPEFGTGSEWRSLGGAAQYVTSTKDITVVAGTTNPTMAMVYRPGNLNVYVNGVRLLKNEYIATGGSTVTINKTFPRESYVTLEAYDVVDIMNIGSDMVNYRSVTVQEKLDALSLGNQSFTYDDVTGALTEQSVVHPDGIETITYTYSNGNLTQAVSLYRGITTTTTYTYVGDELTGVTIA